MKKLFTFIAVSAVAATAFAQQSYSLDKNHAKLTFSAVHFGISHVEGRFKNFDATLKSTQEDFTDAVIEMTAEVKSIDTDVEMRDKDLRSDSWFDAEKFPLIIFKSTSFKKVNGNQYKLEGKITMHGVTKDISFDVTYNGKVQNPFSKKYSAGFTVSGKLNRKDFGIGEKLTAGVVGEEISVASNVEFIMN